MKSIGILIVGAMTLGVWGEKTKNYPLYVVNVPAATKSADGVTILTAQGGITLPGQLRVVDAEGARLAKWYVRQSGANSIKLHYQNGVRLYLK